MRAEEEGGGCDGAAVVVEGTLARRMSDSTKSSMSPSLGSDRSLSDTSSTRGCDMVVWRPGVVGMVVDNGIGCSII